MADGRWKDSHLSSPGTPPVCPLSHWPWSSVVSLTAAAAASNFSVGKTKLPYIHTTLPHLPPLAGHWQSGHESGLLLPALLQLQLRVCLGVPTSAAGLA